jgi:O-antigen ligase
MGVQWEISYRGKDQVIESWDNHFAYALFQSGMLGLVATLLLYLNAVRPVWMKWVQSIREARDISACLLAASSVQIFMMTNVLIFAKQLDYLFWTVVATGFVIANFGLNAEQNVPIGNQKVWLAKPNPIAS